MTHPLALYAVQVQLAERIADADAERLARKARSPRSHGLVASIRSLVSNALRRHDASSAPSPA